jgi:hypothetical protein
MISCVKPLLTEDLCVVQKEEFSITFYTCECTFDERPSTFIKDRPIFSSERMLNKDHDSKSSAEKKISDGGSQGG